MRKRICLLALVVALLVTGVDAVDDYREYHIESQASHNILLDGISWISYDLDCQEGDTLSGSFEVTCDGSLYIGDQQKYDDWMVEGIQFYLLDEGNYSLFIERLTFDAFYVRNDVISLSWAFQIPMDGIWYIIYYNDSIYMKNIDGTLHHTSGPDALVILLLGFVGAIGVLGIVFIAKRKYESHG